MPSGSTSQRLAQAVLGAARDFLGAGDRGGGCNVHAERLTQRVEALDQVALAELAVTSRLREHGARRVTAFELNARLPARLRNPLCRKVFRLPELAQGRPMAAPGNLRAAQCSGARPNGRPAFAKA